MFKFDIFNKKEGSNEKGKLTKEEQLDIQISAEAKKLGTSINKLKQEIDAKINEVGGKDVFEAELNKVLFANEDGSIMQNVAGKKLRDLVIHSEGSKESIKFPLLIGLLCYILTAISVAAGISDNPQMNQMEATLLTALTFVGGSAGVGVAIGQMVDSRSYMRQKNKEELKFKMMGVEPIDNMKRE